MSQRHRGADLAPDQLAAVAHAGGAARIIAPAGSGKTRVLTERARHLLDGWRLPPSAVSLVAFNKRAQEEMRERTADLPGLQVRTLNAIALAIVNGVRAVRSPSRDRGARSTSPRSAAILGELVQLPEAAQHRPGRALDRGARARSGSGCVDPLEVERRYGGDVDGLAEVWPRYRAALEREGAVDFDDQIYRAIEVLLDQPDARRGGATCVPAAARRRVPGPHARPTSCSSGCSPAPGGAVFGVGDDDQTIYGYNGADPAWLIDFGDLFPGAGDHPLEVNYRCPAGIVESVDRLLRHNRRRVPKTIRAAAVEPDGWSVDTSDDPVRATTARRRSGAGAAGVRAGRRRGAHTGQRDRSRRCSWRSSRPAFPVAGGVGLEFADRTVGAGRARLVAARHRRRGALRADDLAEALRRPSRPLHPRVAEWVAEQGDVAGLRRLAARLNAERDTERVASFADDIERMQRLRERRRHRPTRSSTLCSTTTSGWPAPCRRSTQRGTA